MLNVSIVLYNTCFLEVEKVVKTLRQSLLVQEIFLIDNSSDINLKFQTLNSTYIFNNKNLGYGKAHNIALRKTIAQNTPFHLVVNADILFEVEILSELMNFMYKNSEIGLIMPKIIYPNGKIQYLCKLIPSPLDLFGRRFLPERLMRKRMEQFEMRTSGYNKIMDVPYLSGCFMLLRTEVLKTIGLFDERFFMYPEDIDLTRRIHTKYRTVFYPNVSVVHAHAKASYKSKKLLWIHSINLARYFNKWGWFFDVERKKINSKIKHTLIN